MSDRVPGEGEGTEPPWHEVLANALSDDRATDAERRRERRGLESFAETIGERRRAALDVVANMEQGALELLPDCRRYGVSVTRLVELTGVSRQTIYRWLAAAEKNAA